MALVAAAALKSPALNNCLQLHKAGLHVGAGLLKKKDKPAAKCVEKCSRRQLEIKMSLLDLPYLQPATKQVAWSKFKPAPPKVEPKVDVQDESDCRNKAECGASKPKK